jgi:ribosome maturation protein Sdo1
MANDEQTEAVAIAADASQSADERMRKIAQLDSRFYGKSSTEWASLLRISDAAVRQTDFWKVDRKKHLGDG